MEENNEETKGVCVACGATDVSVNDEGKCGNCAVSSDESKHDSEEEHEHGDGHEHKE